MSLSERVAPHIPYLRRFARALSGSQASGDSHVAATLEAIVSDPSIIPEGLDDRAALYSVFLRLWNSLEVNREADEPRPDGEAGSVDLALARLEPQARETFLLTAVEGFTAEDCRAILDCSPEAFEALLDEAGREIAGQVATDILIIEDEPLIAMDLEALVEGLGHTICAIARSREEAVRAARTGKPGLILADIQLADGTSGLDAVNDILTSVEVPVVFITAYPERLLTGERPEPTFLITKPFQPDMVKAVISQALFFDTKAHPRGAAA